MFSKVNIREDEFNTLSMEELYKQLKNVEEQVEAQKRSIETVGGRGIISGPMSNKLLAYYQERKQAIEEEIKSRSHHNSNRDKLLSAH